MNGSTAEATSVKVVEQENLGDLPSGPFMEDSVDREFTLMPSFTHSPI